MGGKSLTGVRGAITRVCLDGGHPTPTVTGYGFALAERTNELLERLLVKMEVDPGPVLEPIGDRFMLEMQDYVHELSQNRGEDDLEIVGGRDDGTFQTLDGRTWKDDGVSL